MSLLPSKTFANSSTPLYATQAQLASLSTSIQSINISTAQGAGVSVSEPTLNNFVFQNALSNAGGLSFVTIPGSSTLGLSNAGVTSVAVGTGLSTSGSTGAITLANTGVTSVSAGTGVTLTGTASAPVVNNSIAASVNQVLNVWSSTPIGANTPVGGGKTLITTWGSLVVGKTYLFSISGSIACGAGTISAGDKGMLIGVQPTGTAEQLPVFQVPVSYFDSAFSTSFVITMPQTSLDIFVQGDGTTTEIVSASLDNGAIVQLN